MVLSLLAMWKENCVNRAKVLRKVGPNRLLLHDLDLLSAELEYYCRVRFEQIHVQVDDHAKLPRTNGREITSLLMG